MAWVIHASTGTGAKTRERGQTGSDSVRDHPFLGIQASLIWILRSAFWKAVEAGGPWKDGTDAKVDDAETVAAFLAQNEVSDPSLLEFLSETELDGMRGARGVCQSGSAPVPARSLHEPLQAASLGH